MDKQKRTGLQQQPVVLLELIFGDVDCGACFAPNQQGVNAALDFAGEPPVLVHHLTAGIADKKILRAVQQRYVV